MKKIHLILALLIACTLSFTFTSCSEEKLGPSIFDVNPPVRTAFDYWLIENFVKPFNVRVLWRYEDMESDFRYNLLPAELGLAKKMAQITKHVWFDAYAEAVSEEFLRLTSPRIIQFIGSRAYNPADGTFTLGTAEGGMKVTLYMVNHLEMNTDFLNRFYFWVMHHEFAHILHQVRMYPLSFREITPAVYIGNDWPSVSRNEAFRRGVITPYSLFSADEDFVEMFTAYILTDPATWESWMQIAATGIVPATSITGRQAIEQKLAIIKTYMWEIWGLDMDLMREISLRRAQEVLTMEFLTFGEEEPQLGTNSLNWSDDDIFIFGCSCPTCPQQ